MLPDSIQNEVRRLVLDALQAYAVPRSEFAALQARVHALQAAQLSPQDHEALALLLPALAELRRGVLVTAAEVLALATVAPGAAGDALRAVAMRCASRDPGKTLGRLMTRCAAAVAVVDGRYLVRFDPPHRRASALYAVAGL
jgi:hypothetical protein